MTESLSVPPFAGNHPANTDGVRPSRGDLQSPQTVAGAERMRTRVLSVKLEPSSDQWARLRELAWQAMRYRNAFLRARWAEAVGLRVDPGAGDKADVTKKIRREEKAELSGSAYSAAEREVQAVWTRDGKKIMAGAPLSQWRHNDSLSIRGHKNRNESGVRLVESDAGRFIAQLQVQSQDCDGGCWMDIPLAPGTEIDEYQAPKMRLMAQGVVPMLKGTLVFVPTKGKTFLKIAYETPYILLPMGNRVATLGPVLKDGRLLLRTETQTIDYTAQRQKVITMGDNWDLIRRRVMCQIGRRKGSARAKRRKFAKMDVRDWVRTYLHQWSRSMVSWLQSQGVGTLVMLDLGGGTWPGDQFEQMLKYKLKDASIVVSEASLDDESTSRAATNAAKKEQRKARTVRKSIRNLKSEV